MTVQELIDKLQQVEDKNMKVMFTTHVDERFDERFGVNCDAEFAEIIKYGAVEEAKSREWHERWQKQGSSSPAHDEYVKKNFGTHEAYFKRYGDEKRVYLRDSRFSFHDHFIDKKL